MKLNGRVSLGVALGEGRPPGKHEENEIQGAADLETLHVCLLVPVFSRRSRDQHSGAASEYTRSEAAATGRERSSHTIAAITFQSPPTNRLARAPQSSPESDLEKGAGGPVGFASKYVSF